MKVHVEQNRENRERGVTHRTHRGPVTSEQLFFQIENYQLFYYFQPVQVFSALCDSVYCTPCVLVLGT